MSDGLIFDIQHYAVHDGPGIRTLVFLKGCPLRCLWCCNPESQNFGPELKHSQMRCLSCYECAEVCPSGAILRGESGPAIDRRACRTCGSWPCVDTCPRGAMAKVGTRTSAGEVMERIVADEAFYRNSGGGVTFSGGEPFVQPEFLEDLLSRCAAEGIRTAVETCGFVPAETMLRLEPLVGLFLYDVKVMDCGEHVRFTGVSNAVILENLRALADRAPGKINIRVPLVPGCTDSRENLAAVADLAASLRVPRAELMPYHELGRDKYTGLGREYPVTLEGPLPGPERLQRSLDIFRDRGIACEIGGE